mgnify:CR=1 FL=1
MTVSDLPTLNAALNATTFVLLLWGGLAIRSGNRGLHQKLMIAATLVSAAFLASYLVYHYEIGSKRYLGEGWLRPVYFTILISHTILAVVMLPMILTTLFRAWKGDFVAHRSVARKTWPIWLYVSITGVVIYLFLYIF